MIMLSLEEKKEIGYQFVRDLLEPVSPYGVKRLREEGFYAPDRKAELERELDDVALLKKALESDRTAMMDLRQKMAGLKDLSGTFSRCLDGFVLTEVELFELCSFCRRINEMIPAALRLQAYGDTDDITFTSMEKPMKILCPDGNNRIGFYIEDTRTSELHEARKRKRDLEKQIRMQVNPDMLHTIQSRQQDKDGNLLRQRQEAAAAEEKALAAIYTDLSEALCPYMPLFRMNADAAARLDAALAKAILADRFDCVRPNVGGSEMILLDAVHPQVAAALETDKRSFSPVTVRMPKGVTVLTGANMGGKSVALRTVVLNAALALSGCFVFCREASVPVFERIDLISRDLSDMEIGLSSFGAEIIRFNETAAQIPDNGLALIAMDEFARGTNAGEGAAIVKAAVKYLSGKNAVTLLATHYDGAAEFAAKHYQVKGLRKNGKKRSEDEGNLPKADEKTYSDQRPAGLPERKYPAEVLRRIGNAMDYGLIEVPPGTECPRDAVMICRMLDLPDEILNEIGNE
ncbi:MAG: hypothetical protein IJI07_11715 [Flexilinea sp.]|nr:hypothetical protein [Flexilinea sp.]